MRLKDILRPFSSESSITLETARQVPECQAERPIKDKRGARAALAQPWGVEVT